MAFIVTRTNEILVLSEVLPGSHASHEDGFDAALDACSAFLKTVIGGSFGGNDEVPKTVSRHKLWIENRSGTDRGCHLRYDFHDGEEYQTNTIAWIVTEE